MEQIKKISFNDTEYQIIDETALHEGDIPTNVSAFTNDAGYLTEHQSLDGLATEDYVNTQIATIPTPDVSGQIGEHNISTTAHNDIRLLIEGLTTRLNTLANSDDTTLDQMAELVEYIKDNRELIEGITTSKVNVADIINNLTTNVTNKPLSAAQGVALKALIDAIDIPTKVSELTNDSGYLTEYTETDPTVPSWAKASTKPSYTKSEVGLGNVDNVKQYSASNPPPYPVTAVNNKTGAVTLDASDVGAVPASRTVNGKALSADITISASDVGADTSGAASSTVSAHNTNTSAHADIREQISQLSSEKVVLYREQTLTNKEKAQARKNIGAMSVEGDAAYTNLAEPLPDNTTDTAKWVNGYRISSSGVSVQSGKTVTNPIAISRGDVIRVKGVSFIASSDRYLLTAENTSAGPYCLGHPEYVSALPDVHMEYILKDDVHEFTYVGTNTAYTHVRFSFTTPADATQVIITVNEKIINSYDARFEELENRTTNLENMVVNDNIPDYWENYLSSKVSTIRGLQDNGGKDCFSFVVMADMHYPSNLGKRSPAIAKRILDKCDIRYALCLGDVQTRGCHNTKELLLAENEAIEEMLSPIRDRLLQTEGNHDGSYGWLDRDGNGEYNNTDANGDYKEPSERETYVNNLTPAELHSAIYRKVGLVGDVHFDESGSGYYIDDTANKVRYIVLNTHCNDYELQEDGTSKYPKMWIFRFTQPQFDLVIDALNNIPSASWGVVVAGHCPLYQEIGDREIMQGVLNAYKNKTTYSGTYAGTAEGGMTYKNLAEPLPDNTTDTSKWVNGYRFGSSGISAQNSGYPSTLSNMISCKYGDVIRIKGVELRDGADRIELTYTNASTGVSGSNWQYYNSNITIGNYNYIEYLGFENGIYTYKCYDGGDPNAHTITGFRFAMPTPTDATKVIITVNEEIVEGAVGGGYDAVSVECDFSNAKGELVGYFAGHNHSDNVHTSYGFNIITTRCDAVEEYEEIDQAERVKGTTTEQSFDVFTVNKAERKIYATKIGAGDDREISY